MVELSDTTIWNREDEEFGRMEYIKFMRERCGNFERMFGDSPMNQLTQDTYVRQSLGEMVKEKIPTPRGLEERDVEHQREFRQALNLHRKLVVIGRAGRGKTSLLYWAALDYLKELEEKKIGVVPVYVPLKDLRKVDSMGGLMEYVDRRVKEVTDERVAKWLWSNVEHSNVLLLLDALDEVPRESRDDNPGRMALLSNRSILADLVRQLDSPHARIVLTCRDSVYTELAERLSGLKRPGETEGFVKMELKKFNRDQIIAYAKQFFKNEAKVQAFLKDIEDPRGGGHRYTHLAEEPLYLHMLCWLWAQPNTDAS